MGNFPQSLVAGTQQTQRKKTAEKRLFEVMAHLAKAHQTLDSLRLDSQGEPLPVRSFLQVFNECLEKYDRGAAKYGEFDPINDKRDLVEEAQQELIDAINYIAMFCHQAEVRNVNEEDGDHDSYDVEKWWKENSDDTSEANVA
jgi:hypothetical protein